MNDNDLWLFFYRTLLALAEMIRRVKLDGVKLKRKCSVTLDFPGDQDRDQDYGEQNE